MHQIIETLATLERGNFSKQKPAFGAGYVIAIVCVILVAGARNPLCRTLILTAGGL
jgi:hypothetical protein